MSNFKCYTYNTKAYINSPAFYSLGPIKCCAYFWNLKKVRYEHIITALHFKSNIGLGLMVVV